MIACPLDGLRNMLKLIIEKKENLTEVRLAWDLPDLLKYRRKHVYLVGYTASKIQAIKELREKFSHPETGDQLGLHAAKEMADRAEAGEPVLLLRNKAIPSGVEYCKLLAMTEKQAKSEAVIREIIC